MTDPENPIRVFLDHSADGGIRLTVDVPPDAVFPGVEFEANSAFFSWPTENKLRRLIREIERERDERPPVDPQSWKGLAQRATYGLKCFDYDEAQKQAFVANWAKIVDRFDADPRQTPQALSDQTFEAWVATLDLSPVEFEAMHRAMQRLITQAKWGGIAVSQTDHSDVAYVQEQSTNVMELHHV